MQDKIFLDSNIFLYAFTNADSKKQKTASKIILNNDIKYFISLQVINEVSNNMLKKLNFTNSELKEFINESYKKYHISDISQNTFLLACDIRDDYNISYYDSLILSSAINSKCNIIYSEDIQDKQKIQTLSIVNPFKNEIVFN